MLSQHDLQSALIGAESDIRRIYGRKASRLGARYSVDDLVQDAQMNAWRRFGGCKAQSVDELRAWVHAVARTTYQTAVRHTMADCRSLHRETATLNPSVGDDCGTIEPQAPEASQVDADEVAQMLTAVDSLPQQRAQAVRMRFLDGMDYDAIAERLGTSNRAVRSLVSRGLATLRSELVGA